MFNMAAERVSELRNPGDDRFNGSLSFILQPLSAAFCRECG